MSRGARLAGTPEPMHFWEGHGGVRIAGDSWGYAGRPLVVLLHGGGQTRHAWRGTGARLAAAGYHAVAMDARGHGDSGSDPDGIYRLDAMAQDVKCVVQALGSRRPVLVGASMGGGTGLVAVGDGHVDAAALVLVDIAPRVQSEGIASIEAFMERHAQGFDSLEEVAQAVAVFQPHRRRGTNLESLARNVRLGGDGRLRWHWDPNFRAQEFRFEMRPQRLEACAARLALPTLLVRGGLSDVLSESDAQAFLDVCPAAEYVCVGSAAHMVAGDRNDMFANAVIDFLLRAVPATGDGT